MRQPFAPAIGIGEIENAFPFPGHVEQQAVGAEAAVCFRHGRPVIHAMTVCRHLRIHNNLLRHIRAELQIQREWLIDLYGVRPAEHGESCIPSPDIDRSGIALTDRSEEHTSELQSLMRISYAVFCLKKKKTTNTTSI